MSLKTLWGLLASNRHGGFRTLFFGFACCVQKGATALVRDWEGGFDSAKRRPHVCCHQYRLCLFCPYVFSWGAPPVGQRASLGLGHVKQD